MLCRESAKGRDEGWTDGGDQDCDRERVREKLASGPKISIAPVPELIGSDAGFVFHFSSDQLDLQI